jgi:peptidoglycan/xylan/chitin deacetylase (PgdA/CDA1 family)
MITCMTSFDHRASFAAPRNERYRNISAVYIFTKTVQYAMTQIIPSLIIGSPLILGGMATLIFGRRSKLAGIPGLLFHSVLPKPRREMSHFPLKRFEAFCQELRARNYSGILVKDARDARSTPTNEKKLLITFDDGLCSFYHYALPVLENSGLYATVFCLGNNFGTLSTWDVYTHNRHLSKQEIREISDRGHEVGSHTMSHPCLSYLDNRAIKIELTDSRKVIEDITGKSVTSLAFPYGAWNRRIWTIAKESGYTAATLYRGQSIDGEALYPVLGAYQYDTATDLIDKIERKHPVSPVLAAAIMMSHFARGTPVWKYRKEYITM